MCVHVHTLTCRQEDSLENASGAIYLAFHCCFHLFFCLLGQSLIGSLSHTRGPVLFLRSCPPVLPDRISYLAQLSWVSWAAESRQSTHLLSCVLGLELKSAGLHSKHSADWTTSQPLESWILPSLPWVAGNTVPSLLYFFNWHEDLNS